MPILRTKHEDFFKTWSSDMAYVLGFFAADGSMYRTRRGTHFIGFQITDGELLKAIRDALGSNHKIGIKKAHANNKTVYQLQIGSKVIFNDLIKLGMTPAKSKTIFLPDIPKDYFADFLRGYFDGDGHVSSGTYKVAARKNPKRILLSGFTSGSKIFLEQLLMQSKRFGIRGGSLYYSGGGYRLSFSILDSLALYKIMYASGPKKLFLKRKRERFEKYFGLA
jgi:hypothetical protein